MRSRVLGALTSAVALTLILTACSTGGTTVNPDLDVNSAKQITQQTERDIVAALPAESVASTEQAQQGVLLSCNNDRGYQWTGSTRIHLLGSPDVSALVQSVYEQYSQRPTYVTKQSPTALGRPGIHIIGEYGAGYLLSAQKEADQLEILSFSPCFRLPEDQWAGGTY